MTSHLAQRGVTPKPLVVTPLTVIVLQSNAQFNAEAIHPSHAYQILYILQQSYDNRCAGLVDLYEQLNILYHQHMFVEKAQKTNHGSLVCSKF